MGHLGTFSPGQYGLLCEPTRVLSGIAFSATLLVVLIPCLTFKGLSHLDQCLAFLSGPPLVQSPALPPTQKTKYPLF